MISSKERAAIRMKAKWEEDHKEMKNKKREVSRRSSLVAVTMKTPGWEILSTSYKKSIDDLIQNLYKTSPFRVFKCMQIRSQIKAYRKMLGLMMAEEKKALMNALKN